MKKTCTRLISCVLAALMLITFIPFSASAAQDEPGRDAVSGQADSVETDSGQSNPNSVKLLSESPTDGAQIDDDAQFIVALTSKLRSGGSSVMRLKGGGHFGNGSEATVTAYSKKGFSFIGWFDESDSGYADCLSKDQSYTFTVTADVSLVALYERSSQSVFDVSVTGSRFKINEGSVQANSAKFSYNAGERVFISYTDQSMKFLYWENASRNIVSTDKDYSFILVNDVDLNAIYTPVELDDTTALVVFRNAYNQILWTHTYSVNNPESIFYPKAPTKMGYVFSEWQLADDYGNPSGVKATDESIRAAMKGNDNVVVPVYTPVSENTFNITLKFVEDSTDLREPVNYTGTLGDPKNFTAPKIDGKVFLCWKLNGSIVGYDKLYTLIRATNNDVILEAVYGDSEAEKKSFISLTQVFCSKNNDKYVLSHTMQYYIPDNWTMAQAGFLYSRDPEVGASEDSMVITNNSIKRHIIGSTDNRSIYTFNLNTAYPDRVFYVRGYINYKDDLGNLHTDYTDIVAHSYNDINNIRYTVKWLNADGTLLDSDASVPFGAVPVYHGETPTMPASGNTIYTFTGWTPEISEVTGDITYKAVYAETERTFSGPVWNWNGLTEATASFTADDDVSVVQTVNAQISDAVTTQPTCTDSGLRTITATAVFGGNTYTDIKTVEVSALGHDFGEGIVTKSPTCTEKGEETHYCSRCDATVTHEIDALGHNLVHHEAKAATCTEVGYDEYDTCSRCDYTTYNEIPALGHDYKDTVIESDCTESGYTIHTCSRCGDSYTDTPVDALGHNFGDWTVTTAPTCTSKGVETRYCSRCDAFETREVEALGHDLIHHDAKAATCTEKGWNAYDTCSRCDYTTYVEIPATGHTPAEAVHENEVAATCTTDGSYDEVVYCSVCGEELSRETKTVSALGHDLIHHDAQAATATSVGWEAYDECSRCDYTTYVEIPKLPSVTVTNEEPINNLPVYRYNELDQAPVQTLTQLDAAYKFKSNEPDEDTAEYYGNWKADYRVSFNKAVAAESFGLYGAYNGYGNEYSVAFLFPNDINAGSPVYLLEAAGLGTVTYNDILNNIKEFICGVFNLDAINAGTEMTVELVIWNDGDPEGGTVIATENYTLGDTAEIKCNHIWGEWTVTTAPTCTEKGEETRYCSRCDAYETREVDALGHDLVHHDAKAPTCTEIGWEAYDTCSRCDYTTYLEIPATGHTATEAVHENEVAVTCTSTGSYDEVVYCSVCGEELSRETKTVPALGHDLVHHDAKAATCTEKGWNAYDTCSRCDYTTYAEIPARGHTSAEAVHENEVTATCTSTGSYDEVVYCSVCGEELSRETKTIPALGHDLVHHDAKAATCTEKGWNAYDTCSRCDYTTYVEIPATGHTPAEAVHENEVAATCTSNGSYDEVVYCSVCGEELSRETKTIPALGHDFGDWTVTTAPTCTEKGEETRYCSRCDAFETREVEALGHDLIHHDAKAPTCTENGWEAYDTCSRCDYTTYAELPANGHSFGEWTVTTPATCTDSGVETRTCSVCGETETREISATGHSWNSTPAWTWNGTSSATATFTCDNDNNHKQEVSATITSAEGTGTDKGYTVYTATAEFNNESYTNTKKELITYTITYNLDNGSVSSSNPTSYNVITASFTLNNPTREGFDFAGWTGTGLSSATDTVNITTGSTGNRTYTATWTPKALNTFTHSDNLAHTDTYLYRVGNGNTVSLGTLFKVNGTGTPDPSNVKIKVESVEANSSVRGTGSNLESGSNAKCTYTKNATDWTSSTLKFTGEGPVKVTISEGSGETYTLNLEVVTGKNIVADGKLDTSTNSVLLNNINYDNQASSITLSNKKVFGNGFTIDLSNVGDGATKTHGIFMLQNTAIDNAVIIGPAYTKYVDTHNSSGYASTICSFTGSNSITNCYITGAASPLKSKTDTYVSNTVLSGGIFTNFDINGGRIVTENLTTVGTGKDLGIVFDLDCSAGSSITINGTLTQHNFIADNASMSGNAVTLKNKMFTDGYSEYQFTSGNRTYVNAGIISMTENVGADDIIDNRSDKRNYSGKTANMSILGLSVNGYVYTMENTDYSMLETSYTEPAYTPNAQNPYEPVFDYTVSSGDAQAAGGDTHCYKDNDNTLQIQFTTGGSKTVNPLSYPTLKRYGSSIATPSLFTVIKDSNGIAVPIINNTVTFTDKGLYTLNYLYENVYVYDKDLGTTTKVNYTKTVKVNVTVKKNAPNATVTVNATTGSMIFGNDGTSSGFNKDFRPYAGVLSILTIKDTNASGTEYTVLDGTNQSEFLSKISSVVPDSDNKTGFTIYLVNGTKLYVKCDAPFNSGTLLFKKNNNQFYMGGSVCYSYSNHNGQTRSWKVTKYQYTGENGVTITVSGTYTFTGTCSNTNSMTALSYAASLVYNLDGGEMPDGIDNYTTTKTVTLPLPTKDGYTFLNWNTQADGSGTARNAGTQFTWSSNTTLYAIWAKNVEVTFISDGSTVSVISGGAGTTNTLPTATQTTQWLEGWYTEDFSGGTKIGNAGASFTVPASDTTYYAHWSPKYAVSYNANGGTVNPDSAIFGGTALILPTPANGSKTFEGWFTAAEGGTKIGTAGDSYVPTTNIELFAQWSDNILVTFDGNGGTAATNSDTYDHVTPITLPTATWAGHQFNGWYTAASGGTKIGNAGDSYTPAEATTLHAQWTAYTVTYDANGGSVSPSSASAGSNGSVTLATPTRTGYTFNGWYTETSGGTKIGNGGASYTPTANITIHAQWSINSYKVTITTSNSSTAVTVNGTTVNNGGSVAYNSVVKVVLSYSQSNSLTFTIKQGNTNVTRYSDEACTKTTTSTAAGTYYFKMPAGEVTINSSSTSGNCVPSGTMVTLADGSKKAVEDLTEDDRVLVFNHETGEFEEQGIIFYEADGVDDYNVVNLSFSDGSVTRLIYEHGYFDLDEMQYVYIREDNCNDYIGHRFAKIAQNDDGYTIESVTLTDAYVTEEHTGCFSFPSVYCLNFIADDFLSMPGGINGMFNFFDYDEDLKYNGASMAADIETYGLMDYSFFEEYMTYEEFSAYPAQYLNVALGKGLMTQEWLNYLISRYVIEKR